MLKAQWRQGNQVISETHYYISSRPADARALLQAVRSHWGIENALHWILDMNLPGGHKPHPHRPRRPQPLDPATDGPSIYRAARPPPRAASPPSATGWNDGYLLKVLSNWNAIALGITAPLQLP